ncbi:hypothetical protein V502_03348 [Pseudogymnoascus sp. VKM F-4520 (FW-2644)]|nr:hypothetical protein V502_03348 [Pseudogymnoascus sp. VKM F-4520 (FW-2644)]
MRVLPYSFDTPTIFEFPTRVSLSEVRASNSLVASTLPPGLVAVFAGATSGIAEATLKQFAKHTVRPRIYYIGEFEEASNRVAKDLKRINREGEYIFVKADLITIKTVDEVCKYIKNKEDTLNLLFLTMGVGNSFAEYTMSLTPHSRACFMHNLLPLLQVSSSFRRFVTVFYDTQKDHIATSDLQGRNNPLRGHPATFMTLSLATAIAPKVSFINCFSDRLRRKTIPNATGLMRVKRVIDLLLYKPIVEPGACYLFLATSARYPACVGEAGVAGVPAGSIATGTDTGVVGGVYTINVDAEAEGVRVARFLAKKKMVAL